MGSLVVVYCPEELTAWARSWQFVVDEALRLVVLSRRFSQIKLELVRNFENIDAKKQEVILQTCKSLCPHTLDCILSKVQDVKC
jgi:hypothetical protein